MTTYSTLGHLTYKCKEGVNKCDWVKIREHIWRIIHVLSMFHPDPLGENLVMRKRMSH